MQPEAFAISQWMKQHQFILSASYHGGALVASFPFDNKDHVGGDRCSYLGVSKLESE